MNKKKRLLALLLAVSMVIPNVSYVNADDDSTTNDAEIVSEQEQSLEITDTEYVVGDSEGNVVEEGMSEEEVASEEVTKEKQPTFAAPIEGVDVSGIDFSSKQLLVGTEDENIFTWDTTVVSGYNGIYLTEYASEEETRNAYTYYFGRADFVDANITFTVSDNEESEEEPKETADLSEMNTGDDAISNLNDMDTAGTVPAGTIAVIDTGINADGLVESVSVIGESTSDDNGHGTRMYDYIKAEYPDAKVLSIKALGSDGKGQVSDVYAAIQYAIEKRVSVINLSISAYSTAESDVIRTVIEEAVAQGIVVVGAAGNDGKNVRYFIPGNIDLAVIVGASDGTGQKIAGSNYGATVDYNVEADSTSEAAAKMSAIISRNDGTNIAKIFTTDYSEEEEKGELITYENSEFVMAYNDPYNGQNHVNDTYVIANKSGGSYYYDYYDRDGHAFSSGIDCDGFNAFCIDSALHSGADEDQIDIIPEKSNNETLKKVVYYAITNHNYFYAHYIIGYYMQTECGRDSTNDWPNDATVYDSNGGSRTISESISIAKNYSIPSNKKFTVYILNCDAKAHPTRGEFQSFLSWKLEDALDYYIAIKKVDSRNYEMNGVTFSISYHNNDTNTDVTIPGGYINGKYSGIWTGFRINYKDEYGTSYRETDYEGVGAFYLGKFANEPTNIRVTENWRGRSDTGSSWAGGKAELVTQKKTSTLDRKSENVYSKDYAPNTSYKIVTAYDTEAKALNNASDYTFTNYHYGSTSLEKEAVNKSVVTGNSNYSMTGIKYGLYGDAACTELIATVTLTDNGDGTAKIASLNDITINKTSTNNNSEPYKATIGGKHSIGGLMWANYYWKEISAPATSGYLVNTSSKTATVNVNHASAPLVIKDPETESRGRIRVHKLLTGDSSSGTSPAGATYELKGTGAVSNINRTLTIAANGYSAYADDLPYGTYTVKEKTVPTTAPTNGVWSIDSTTYTVILNKNSGTHTVPSSVAVTATDATVESTDVAYRDYYVAVKKVDGNGYAMNGITFDITINGTTKSKALVTGKDYNGTSYVDGTNGVGSYYIGRLSTAPTVTVKENWTETWNKTHFVHDTTTKSPAVKNTLAEAKNNAAAYTYTNYSYGFATMHKESTGTVLSMDGIQYQLYRCINGSGTAVNTLIATVTLNANGYIKSVSLSDSNCWQETIDGVICIGGLTYNPTPTTPITNNYYWVESQTNDNYELNTTKYYITVNKSNATKPGTDNTKYPSVYTFTPASATGKDNARAYVGIYKKDENNKAITATFDIYGTNTSGATSGGTKVGTITTNGTDGKGTLEVTSVYNPNDTNVNGKYKFFYAVETHTAANHEITIEKKALTVHKGAMGNSDYITWINPTTPFVKLTKTSANPTCTNGNPNYSLIGTTFKMYGSRADARTAIDSGNYGTALATITITASDITNNQGIKTLDVSEWMDTNADGTFKNTTFYFVESAAGKNYQRSEDISAVTVTGANTSTNPAQLNVANTPVNDPVNIALLKTDKITGSNKVPEGKSLAGAQFQVDFYAADIETVLANANGNVAAYLKANYTPNANYSTTVTITKNAQGKYVTQINKTFPIGFITVTEITPPTDYSLDNSTQYLVGNTDYDVTGNLAFVTYGEFSNNQTEWTEKTYHPYTATTLAQLTSSTGSKHGILVTDSNNASLTFDISVDNTPVRGNLRLNKVRYSNGNPIKGVEFEIKNNATGETHTIVTNSNGNATTVNNSNAWFGLLDDGTTVPYTEGYGSLPVGTYTVTEKRCAANEGLQLLKPATVTIDSTATVLVSEADGKLYNIGMPEITTTARVVETDSKTLAQMGEPQTIEDVVAYKNLRADTTYTLVGRLMVRHPDGTYEAYKKNGTAYTVKKTFTTGATWTKSEFEKSGTVTVNYEGIYAENYEGCIFVVFEKLYLGNTVPSNDNNAAQYPEYDGSDEKIFPVVHENINDEGQTVRPVDVHTTISDNITDDHIAKTGDVTVTDRVYYTGLTVGETYTIKGDLHVTGYTWKDKDGNEIKTVDADDTLLNAEGNPITAEKTFKAETTDGYVDLVFTYDASLLEGESVVAFETLYYKEKAIAVHADLTDEDETIHYPNIHTTLYRGGTEEWAEDFDENDITKHTTADESAKEIMTVEDAVVVDRIKYHNLLANRSYVVRGILMDKAGETPLLDAEGNEITAEMIFSTPKVDAVEDTSSPNAAKFICADGTELDMSADHGDYLVDGFIELTFRFDATKCANKTTVAFEEIYLITTDGEYESVDDIFENDLVLVNEHKDINDADQTVRFPEIHTNANVEETNTKMVPVEGPVTINDTVSYYNLQPGKKYTLTATPVVKGDVTGTYEDGDQLLDKEGKPITGSFTFIPEEPDGEVVVPITFEGYLLPEVDIVCFEDLSNDKGLEIAVHNDIEDRDQTVDVVKVRTTAKGSVSGGEDELATEETVIIDTVSYEKLEKGLTYRIYGTLMIKSTEEPLLDEEGNPVTAMVEFVPEESNGTIDMVFPAFDAIGLAVAGESVVVFEKIYLVTEEEDAEGNKEEKEVYLAHHEDIEDEGQTIHIADIHTTASDSETKDHVGTVGEEVTIVDVVEYKNLIVGKEYTVKGILMAKETGEELLIDGKPVTAEKTFTATEPDGSVELTFTFDSTALEGKTTVVFEDIYREDIHVATHTDIEDEEQTVRYPKVKTKAEDSVTKENIGEAGEETTVIDTVSYWNLEIGKEYTVKGVLMVQGTGEEFLVDGKPVTAEKTFVAEEADGTIELTFTFNSTLAAGETLIVFEDLYHNGIRVAGHTDITDEDQSEHHPHVKTTATDSETGDHTGVVGEKVTIIDKVEYKNLIVDKEYTVRGVLMVKETGEQLMVDGKPVTAEKTFKAETANGYVELTFTFDSSALEDKTVVVFEDVYYKGVRVGTHADIDDEDQTVRYPKVKTKAEDAVTSDNIGEAGKETTIIDTVSYWNLVVGKEYTVKGVLMNQATGKELLVDGKTVTAEKTFIAETEDGTVELTFTFDSSALKGETLIVFEDLYHNGIRVAGHTDITDEDQSEHHPGVKTTAVDKKTGEHIGKAEETVTIVDTVEYTNLIVGKEYTVKGVLMDKDTGEEFLVDRKTVTAEKTFIAEIPDGSIDLEFTFDGLALAGTEIVVFEDMFYKGKRVATHTDLTDENQTVRYPSVHTHVEDTTKWVQPVENVTVVDDVMYSKLKIGERYQLEGILMSKNTGKAVLVNGLPVKVQRTFTAESEDGMITMEFKFDASELEGDVTVFEYLYLVKDEDNKKLTYTLIAEHTDLEDEEQTFMISPVPKTSDDTPVNILFGLLLLSGLGLAYIIWKKREFKV